MQYPQGGRLPIHSFSRPGSIEEVLRLPTCRFDWGWHQEPTLGRAEFILAADSAQLYFCAASTLPPCCDASLPAGCFAPLLWKQDVAEFFLRTGDRQYLELNLSPSGAWWLSYFTDYRKAAELQVDPSSTLQVSCSQEDGGWQAAAALPLPMFDLAGGLDGTRQANVTMIIGGQRRQFLSWSTICSEAPDFHRIEDFVELQPIPAGIPEITALEE